MSRVDLTKWNVHIGVEGPQVTAAQCLINKYRVQRALDPISEDGKAGGQTHDAIVEFQDFHALESDGTIGPIGWAALKEYSTQVDAPDPAPPTMTPPLMRIMIIPTETRYKAAATLWAKAAALVMPLFCVYWRCNVEVVAGSFEEFQVDRDYAILLGTGNGGVEGAAAWHWAAAVQALFAQFGVTISDDDLDPIAWVDMTTSKPAVSFFHEIWEMMVNPVVTDYTHNFGTDTYWIREVCDPVQRTWFDIMVDGSRVSIANWIGPDWFGNYGESKRYGRASDVIGRGVLVEDFELGPYDAMSLVDAAWQLLAGGYQIEVSTRNPADVRWRYGDDATEADVNEHSQRRIALRKAV